ncbi:MAG: hypothetical protein ACE5IK_10095 [Acidobacteriota bacterium]
MKNATVLSLSFLCAGAVFAQGQPASRSLVPALRIHYVTVETVTEVNGDVKTTTREKIVTVTRGSRQRSEFLDQDHRVERIILSDASTGETTELDPHTRKAHRKYVDMDAPAAEGTGRGRPRASGRPMSPLPERTIQGMTCHGHGNDEIEIWECTEPVTGTAVTGLMITHYPFGTITESLDRIEQVEVDPDQIFEVPAGFVISAE